MVWLRKWGGTRFCYGVIVWMGWDKVLLWLDFEDRVRLGIVMVWMHGLGGIRYCYGVVA